MLEQLVNMDKSKSTYYTYFFQSICIADIFTKEH